MICLRRIELFFLFACSCAGLRELSILLSCIACILALRVPWRMSLGFWYCSRRAENDTDSWSIVCRRLCSVAFNVELASSMFTRAVWG